MDEGFYAAVVAEMNRRGEWITPFYNGQPWFEKPILLYWFAKPSMALFGEMIGPRLPSVLFSVATYAVVAWFAQRRLTKGSEWFAPVILGSGLLFVAIGRMMMTDPPLIFALTAAMITFWESLVGDKRWRLVTAICLGLGVLAKGPVAGILFALIAGWTYYREPDLRKEFRGRWLAGGALFALVVASWYVPAYLAQGKLFVDEFLIKQNVGRFTGGDPAHTLGGPASMLLYIPIFLLGMAPWSFWLPKAWKESDPLHRFLKAWLLAIFLFFSISGAKLPHYILPMFPPAALLVADYFARRGRANRFAIGWTVGMALFATLGFNWHYYGQPPVGSGQAELHALCRYVRSHAAATDTVVEYQMSRREHDRGTGKLRLMETSRPSTLMVLNRVVLDTDDWNRVLESKQPCWVITRWDRVGATETQAAGSRLVSVDTDVRQDQYRLWLVKP